jgi:hypothetical protein
MCVCSHVIQFKAATSIAGSKTPFSKRPTFNFDNHRLSPVMAVSSMADFDNLCHLFTTGEHADLIIISHWGNSTSSPLKVHRAIIVARCPKLAASHEKSISNGTLEVRAPESVTQKVGSLTATAYHWV